jgi:hypothetical protein
MREPVPEREVDVSGDAVAVKTQAAAAESRGLEGHAAADAADLPRVAGEIDVEDARDLVPLGETEVGSRSARALFDGQRDPARESKLSAGQIEDELPGRHTVEERAGASWRNSIRHP